MRRAMLYVLVAVLMLLAGQAAFAANQITVTVTLQQIGVSVTPVSWALGVMAPESSQTSWVSGNAGHFTATNDGNVAADLTIAAATTSPSGWAPDVSAVGTDQYMVAFGKAVDPYTSEPTYTPFATSTSLATGVAAAGDVRFDLEFTAPAADSAYNAGGETFTVSLAASAS